MRVSDLASKFEPSVLDEKQQQAAAIQAVRELAREIRAWRAAAESVETGRFPERCWSSTTAPV